MIIRADNHVSYSKKKKSEIDQKNLLKNTRSISSLTDIVSKAIVFSLLDVFNFTIYFQRSMQLMKKGKEKEKLEKEGKQNHL